MNASERPSFRALYRGRFTGLLQWADWVELCETILSMPDGWFVFAARDNAELSSEPLSADVLKVFLTEADAFLRKQQRESYCGAVYVDDRENPAFVKIFHPRRMGSSCGSGGPVLPQWTLSRVRPERLAEPEPEKEPAGLLKRILG